MNSVIIFSIHFHLKGNRKHLIELLCIGYVGYYKTQLSLCIEGNVVFKSGDILTFVLKGSYLVLISTQKGVYIASI